MELSIKAHEGEDHVQATIVISDDSTIHAAIDAMVKLLTIASYSEKQIEEAIKELYQQ